ncbi:MAG: hypothetical protein GX575_32205 [Candidatus Anammoximicrobium sp.]|nr:hypothetical protein [Candidatus Anammoximicrobium sp.]
MTAIAGSQAGRGQVAPAAFAGLVRTAAGFARPARAGRRSDSNGGQKNAPDFGHHAACQRGAMFRSRHRLARCIQHLEHRSTLASSVVAKGADFVEMSGLEHRSTLASSVVAKGADFVEISGLEHRSTLASSVVAFLRIS